MVRNGNHRNYTQNYRPNSAKLSQRCMVWKGVNEINQHEKLGADAPKQTDRKVTLFAEYYNM